MKRKVYKRLRSATVISDDQDSMKGKLRMSQIRDFTLLTRQKRSERPSFISRQTGSLHAVPSAAEEVQLIHKRRPGHQGPAFATAVSWCPLLVFLTTWLLRKYQKDHALSVTFWW